MIIPLPPIPYHTKNYCQKYALEYKTEHDLVVEYISDLNLEDYIGHYDPKEIVVLADSGYDDKKIENTIARCQEKVEIHYLLSQKQKCQI